MLRKISGVSLNAKGIVDPADWIENEVNDLLCEDETHYFSRLKTYFTILKFYHDN